MEASQLSKTEQAVLDAIDWHPDYSYEQLAATCGVSRPTIARTVKSLQAYNRIRRVGSDKTGHWEVINESQIMNF
jgi:DNA-binding MarR family transcriptional regulator